jgi:hypothetical protein
LVDLFSFRAGKRIYHKAIISWSDNNFKVINEREELGEKSEIDSLHLLNKLSFPLPVGKRQGEGF